MEENVTSAAAKGVAPPLHPADLRPYAPERAQTQSAPQTSAGEASAHALGASPLMPRPLVGGAPFTGPEPEPATAAPERRLERSATLQSPAAAAATQKAPQANPSSTGSAAGTKRGKSFEELISAHNEMKRAKTTLETEIESFFGSAAKKAVWNIVWQIGKSDPRVRTLFAGHLDALDAEDARHLKRLLAYWA